MKTSVGSAALEAWEVHRPAQFDSIAPERGEGLRIIVFTRAAVSLARGVEATVGLVNRYFIWVLLSAQSCTQNRNAFPKTLIEH